MSTYNCNCAVDLGVLTKEEETWLKAAFQVIADEPWKTAGVDELSTFAVKLWRSIPSLVEDDETSWGFDYGIAAERTCDIYATDYNPNIDALISFLQLFLREHRPDGHLAFEWGWNEEVAGGGGASLVTAETHYTMNTTTWVEDRVNELKKLVK